MRPRFAALAVVVIVGVLVPAVGSPAATTERDYHALLTAAIADIQDYWSKALPELTGQQYVPIPPSRIITLTGDTVTTCGRARVDLAGNASYCPVEDKIVYDDTQLMPTLATRFGPFAAVVVLAHEWGHVVQTRAGISLPSVYTELQADCFAGAWVNHVATSVVEGLE